MPSALLRGRICWRSCHDSLIDWFSECWNGAYEDCPSSEFRSEFRAELAISFLSTMRMSSSISNKFLSCSFAASVCCTRSISWSSWLTSSAAPLSFSLITFRPLASSSAFNLVSYSFWTFYLKLAKNESIYPFLCSCSSSISLSVLYNIMFFWRDLSVILYRLWSFYLSALFWRVVSLFRWSSYYSISLSWTSRRVWFAQSFRILNFLWKMVWPWSFLNFRLSWREWVCKPLNALNLFFLCDLITKELKTTTNLLSLKSRICFFDRCISSWICRFSCSSFSLIWNWFYFYISANDCFLISSLYSLISSCILRTSSWYCSACSVMRSLA